MISRHWQPYLIHLAMAKRDAEQKSSGNRSRKKSTDGINAPESPPSMVNRSQRAGISEARAGDKRPRAEELVSDGTGG